MERRVGSVGELGMVVDYQSLMVQTAADRQLSAVYSMANSSFSSSSAPGKSRRGDEQEDKPLYQIRKGGCRLDPLMSWSGRGESSYYFFVLLCWAF